MSKADSTERAKRWNEFEFRRQFRVARNNALKILKYKGRNNEENLDQAIAQTFVRIAKHEHAGNEETIRNREGWTARIAQNEAKRVLSKDVSPRLISFEECPAEPAAPQKHLAEVEANSLARELWSGFKNLSFLQRTAILFASPADDFLYLILEDFAAFDLELEQLFGISPDNLGSFLDSLPWQDDSLIAQFISARENRVCTAKQIRDARYEGRQKLKEICQKILKRG